MEQVTDDQLFASLDDESNSIAVIVSIWPAICAHDGRIFSPATARSPIAIGTVNSSDPPDTREALLAAWQQGWSLVFQALEPLSDDDLGRTVLIRGEAHSVMQAVNRQVAHYANMWDRLCCLRSTSLVRSGIR